MYGPCARTTPGHKKPTLPKCGFFCLDLGVRIGDFRINSESFSPLAPPCALLSQRFSMSKETLPFKKRQRLDDGAAAEGGDDAADHPSCPEQDPLAMFDTDFRSHLIDGCAAWAARAKAIAEQVRFGHRREIMWWSRGSSVDFPLSNARLSPDTGGCPFSIDQHVCEQLRSFLADPHNYNEDAVLMVAGEAWKGYSRYPYVHAKLGAAPAAQEKTRCASTVANRSTPCCRCRRCGTKLKQFVGTRSNLGRS